MRKLYYLVMISLASILIACENRSEEWDVVDFGNDCTVGLQEHLECRFIPLETKDSVLLKRSLPGLLGGRSYFFLYSIEVMR